jgi:hypothetical protein
MANAGAMAAGHLRLPHQAVMVPLRPFKHLPLLWFQRPHLRHHPHPLKMPPRLLLKHPRLRLKLRLLPKWLRPLP